MKPKHKTPAKRQAELFIAFAKASKAGEIPEDCRLPDTVKGTKRKRKPAPKQLDVRDAIATMNASRQGACNTEPALTKPQTYEGGSRHGYCTL